MFFFKYKKKVTVVTTVTVVRVVKKNCATSQYFIKSNLTHLTTDVMLSGQRFAIFALFLFGTSILWIQGELAGKGVWLLALVTGIRMHVTCDM